MGEGRRRLVEINQPEKESGGSDAYRNNRQDHGTRIAGCPGVKVGSRFLGGCHWFAWDS
jgi:hypothetical protein